MVNLTRRAPPSLRLAGAALLSALFAATPASPQATPHTGQFQVNTYTTGAQNSARVAAGPGGNFVVVWESAGSVGNDTSGSSIQGRRFSREGTALGPQFQVNLHTTGNQSLPAVAADAAGNFVVAWRSATSPDGDTSGTCIRARGFGAASGEGTELQVNSYTPNDQTAPAIARNASGQFIITFESLGSVWGDTSGRSILVQRFDTDGSDLGVEFQANSYTTGDQTAPRIAYLAGNEFAVVWASLGSSGGDTSGRSIQLRRFTSGGSPIAPDFQVNQSTVNAQNYPAIGSTQPTGDFVVAWESASSAGTDADSSVQARRFDTTGGAGSEFQVNTYTTGAQTTPAVVRDGQGDFVVAWQSYGSDGPDTQNLSVRAQRAFANGAALGGEFQIELLTTDHDFDPAVATDSDGNFVVVWTALDSTGNDLDASIQARLFDALFRDGFEAGSSLRWSLTVP